MMTRWTWGMLGAGIGFVTCIIGGNSALLARETTTEHHHEPMTLAQLQASYASGVTHRISGEYRYITSNGIPNHSTGQFPNRNNPNRISPQTYSFRMPVKPTKTGKATYTQRVLFGVARNGVVFDPGTAEFWGDDRSWRYEALSGKINLGLDQSHAHVQPTGAYHYHGSPDALIALLGHPNQPALLGYAADGFPIYNSVGVNELGSLTTWRSSYRIKSGQRPSGPGGTHDGTFVNDYEYVSGLGDLDECNGRQGITTEFPNGTYYYVITKSFPFVPRCFMGTPDQSFAQQRPANGSGRASQGHPSQQGQNGRPPMNGSNGSREFGPPPGGFSENGRPSRPPHPPHGRPPHPPHF